jgi:outer membrane protein assembly factor BamB
MKQYLKNTRVVFLLLSLLLLLTTQSCSQSTKLNDKDYTLIFGSIKTKQSEDSNLQIKGKRIFRLINDEKQKLAKLERENIKFELVKPFISQTRSNIIFYNGCLYVIDGWLNLIELDLSTLKIKKKVKLQFNRAEKTKLKNLFIETDENGVYVLSNFGKLFLFDIENFKIVYKKDFEKSFNSKPLSDGFYLYLKSSSNAVYSLFASSGKDAWSYESGQIDISIDKSTNPQIFGDNLVIPVGNFKTVVLNKTNGDLVSLLEMQKEKEDGFEINSVKNFDYYLSINDKNYIVTGSQIKNTNYELQDNSQINFYQIERDKLVNIDGQNISSKYISYIDGIKSTTSFKDGLLTINTKGSLYFVNLTQNYTRHIANFVCNLPQKLESFYSDELKSHIAFLSCDDRIYKIVNSDFDSNLAENIKITLLKNKIIKTNQSLSALWFFDDIEHLEFYKNKLYVISGGKIYKTTEFEQK